MVSTCRSSLSRTALVVLALAWSLVAAPADATTQHAAGVVIDTGERVVTVLVEFEEDSITGEQLLRRADVDAVFGEYGSMGKAVCSILGVGSPQEDCFREAEDSGRFWNYSRAGDGRWRRSSRGVSSTTIEHGDVDGWAWGPSGSEPPYHSFEEIRAQHAPAGSPEPSPTPTGEEADGASAEATPPPAAGPAGDGTPTDATPTRSRPTGQDTGKEGPREDGEREGGRGDAPATTSPASPTPTGSPPLAQPTAETTPAAGSAGAAGAGGSGAGEAVVAGGVILALLGAIVWRRRA